MKRYSNTPCCLLDERCMIADPKGRWIDIEEVKQLIIKLVNNKPAMCLLNLISEHKLKNPEKIINWDLFFKEIEKEVTP